MAASRGTPRRQVGRVRSAALVAELEAAGRDLSNAAIMFHAALAEQLGLNATDHKTLDLIEREGPLSPGRLAEVTGLAPASITGVLDRLEARGFIRRARDPADGRRQLIEVVQQRTQEIDRLFDGFVADLRRIHRRYSAAELTVILDYVRRVTEVQRTAATNLGVRVIR